ncbi:MAG: 1-acyl-sn-glycerol-3-phosphate acyltransferase [Anaerolineales bacterium]|nr:1-acyl-sn-glycerol-3-phosphate acyltransferase [Anaerolineales bacterium]
MIHRLNRLIFRWIVIVLVKLLTRTDVKGLENIPTEGGVLMTANHLSVLDAALVFMSLDRQDATGFVAKKHQSNLFYRTVVNLVDGIWLNRYEADTQALRKARTLLKNGGIFGIAPEGTRSSTGSLIPGKTGAAYLADISKVPVQPIAIFGTEGAGHRVLRLERPKIQVTFGELYSLPLVDRKDREAGFKRNTDEIMCRIAAMLPPKYRGVYAEHPRVQELIDSA